MLLDAPVPTAGQSGASAAGLAVYYARNAGIVPGNADNTAPLLALHTALQSSGGGRIIFEAGQYNFTGQLALPNSGGTSLSTQPNIVWQGAGAHFTGGNQVPTSGTIFNMTYHGSPAKIDTRGQGLLEITGITFADFGSSDGTPFIQTTGTTVLIHECGFYGNTAATPTQDAIILGGTTTNNDNSATAAFQGYATIIARNYFNRIRCAVLGRVFCNGVVIRDNTVWLSCGGDATHAPFTLDGTVGNVEGNVISGNLIEAINYYYGVRIVNGIGNAVSDNSFFDQGGNWICAYRIEGTASADNLIEHGYSSSINPLSDVSSPQSTTLITSRGGGSSQFAHAVVLNGPATFNQPVTFQGSGAPPTWISPIPTVQGFRRQDPYGNVFDEQFNYTTSGVANWYLRLTTNTRTVTDAVTNGTTTVTSNTANFTSQDTGLPLSGNNIPASTWISSVTNSTTIVLNHAASGSGTGSLVIGGTAETPFIFERGNLQDARILLLNNIVLRVVGGALNVTTPSGTALSLGDGAHNIFIQNGDVVLSAAALATNATSGFTYLPTCAGVPTGTPNSHTGTVPTVVDTTDGKVYFYTGGAWKSVTPA